MSLEPIWSSTVWEQEVKGGLTALRELDPRLATRLVFGGDKLGRYVFGLISNAPIGVPTLSAAVIIESGRRQLDGKWVLTLTLDDAAYAEVFLRLCSHVYERVLSTTTETAGVASAMECFATWHDLLQGKNVNRLTHEQCRGLYAELAFGFGTLARHLPARQVLEGWEGPYGGDQDFAIDGVRFEVKSHHTTSRALRIASEYQLHGDLTLVTVELDDSRHPLDGYQSLASFVAEVRNDILVSLELQEDFVAALEELRFNIDDPFYEHLYFKQVSNGYYQVNDSFPKIDPQDLTPGVSAVTYHLSLDEITPWKVSESDALAKLAP
ncbi:PD-(D/E)XK motif protein [Arthrobacter cupressi]